MGKLMASEMAERVCSEAIQIHRRLRLRQRLPGRADLARRSRLPDLRRDERRAEDPDRARAGLNQSRRAAMNERHARDVTWLEAFETAQPAGADLERRRPRVGRPRRARGGRAGRTGRRVRRRAGAATRCSGSGRASRRCSASPATADVAQRLDRRDRADRVRARRRRRRDRRRPAHQPAGAAALGRAVCGTPPSTCSCSCWPLVRLARRSPRAPGPLVRAMEALLRSRRLLPRLSAGGSATALAPLRDALARARRVRSPRCAPRPCCMPARQRSRSVWSPACTRAASCSTTASSGRARSSMPAPAHAHRHDRVRPGGAAGRDRRCPTRPRSRRCAISARRSRRGRAGSAVDAPDRADARSVVVVLPRILLALGCGAGGGAHAPLRAAARRSVLPAPAAPGSGGPARVVVHPYGSDAVAAGDARPARLARGYARPAPGARVRSRRSASVARTMPRRSVGPDLTHAVALFDMGATPEAREPGALRACAARGAAGRRGARRGRRCVGIRAPLRRRRRAGRRAARGMARLGRDGRRGTAASVDLESADAAAPRPHLQAALALPARQPRR